MTKACDKWEITDPRSGKVVIGYGSRSNALEVARKHFGFDGLKIKPAVDPEYVYVDNRKAPGS